MPLLSVRSNVISDICKYLDDNAQLLAGVLSTPAGLDSCLSTVCYTSLLLHNVLPQHRRIVDLHILYGILEDTRIFTRLFGLLDLYASARGAYAKQHRDPIIKLLLWSSLASGTAFQILENMAFLVQKQILCGAWLRSKENVFWLISNRFWLMQLTLDLARLLRVRQLRFKKDLGAEEAASEVQVLTQTLMSPAANERASCVSGARESRLQEQWRQELYVTAASVPLAVHWSFEENRSPIGGCLFAASGLVAGAVALKVNVEGLM